MNRITTFLILLVALLPACQKDAYLPTDNEQYLIFGHYYGMCMGEQCIETFKLTQTALYEDTKDPYPGNDDFKFEKLDKTQLDKAKHLFEHIPIELVQEQDSTFGCPDCADGGGLYIEYKNGNDLGKWRIDQSEGHVPKYLHHFMQEVNRTIRDINQ